MTASDARPYITQVIQDMMAFRPIPVIRKLHVSGHVWSFLRDTYAKAISPDAATAMFGLTVVVAADLTGGQWQLHENGEITKSGDMAPAPDGMTVLYSPFAGWIAIQSGLLELPALTEWRFR